MIVRPRRRNSTGRPGLPKARGPVRQIGQVGVGQEHMVDLETRHVAVSDGPDSPRPALPALPASPAQLVLFAAGAALVLYYGRIGFNPFDNGIVFDGAWRLLNGQRFFADFVTPNGFTPIVMQTWMF